MFWPAHDHCRGCLQQRNITVADSVTGVHMCGQITLFSITTVTIFKLMSNYKYFSYKRYTFQVNICLSLQTNIYVDRQFSFWGVIPVLSVGAYTTEHHSGQSTEIHHAKAETPIAGTL